MLTFYSENGYDQRMDTVARQTQSYALVLCTIGGQYVQNLHILNELTFRISFIVQNVSIRPY